MPRRAGLDSTGGGQGHRGGPTVRFHLNPRLRADGHLPPQPLCYTDDISRVAEGPRFERDVWRWRQAYLQMWDAGIPPHLDERPMHSTRVDLPP